MNNNQGNKFFNNINMPQINDNNQNNNQPFYNQNIPQVNANNNQNQLNQVQLQQNNTNTQQTNQNTFSSMNLNIPTSNVQQSNEISNIFNSNSFNNISDNNQKNTSSNLFNNQNSQQISGQNDNPFTSIVDEIIQDTSGTDTYKSINTTNSQFLNNSINILPINQMDDNQRIEEDKPDDQKVKNKKSFKKSKVIQYNSNITDFHRRNLLREFVGFKYEKLAQNKFNIFALLFAEFYVLYRRMVAFGLFILLVRIAMIVYLNPYLSFIINVILCFTFNKIYLSFAKRKIITAEKHNQTASYEQLKDMVVSSGQTKMSNPVFTIFFGIIIAIISIVIANINGFNTGPFKNINILVLLGKNPEFKGDLTYDNKTNINNYYEIVMPEELKKPDSNQENNTIIGGIKTDPNDNFSNCHYSFNVLKDFSDAKNLSKQMAKYYNLKNMPEELQINSITWYHIVYENNGKVSLYLTSRNKKVYMYEFREEKNANSISCEQYNTSILNSIYYK